MTISDSATVSDPKTAPISYFVLTCTLASAYVNLTGVLAVTVVICYVVTIT